MRTPELSTARLIALFVIALLAVVLGASALATSAPAQMVQPTPGPRTLTVSGEGTASAAPDVAYVSLGVQTQGKTAVEATNENSRLMTSVLAALQGRGVRPQDLRTSGLTVTPRYAPPPTSAGPAGAPQPFPPGYNGPHPTGEIVGYEASNNATVTVSEVDRASELLDVALAAGANRVGGLTFRIRDTNGLHQQALADAAQAARARADALAASLGLRVVSIQSVQEEAGYGNGYNAFPEVPALAAQTSQPAPLPPVAGGELTVRTRAQVVFAFE
jgi:uncharacterized protein YggE